MSSHYDLGPGYNSYPAPAELAVRSDFVYDGSGRTSPDWLGSGSEADVYRALHVPSGQVVALKVPNTYVRMGNEAGILAELRHPSIIRALWRSAPDDAEPFLALPVLRKLGSLPLEQTWQALADIASALDYAHACGVLHRDLKPENFLVDDAARGVLGDFGVACHAGDAASQRAVGEPMYRAPELDRDPAAPHTIASDCYSFARAVYVAIAGQAPTAETLRRMPSLAAALSSEVAERPTCSVELIAALREESTRL